jgi:hypothetical protein
MSNRLEVRFNSEDGHDGVGTLDQLPDQCPVCHQKVDPVKFSGFLNTNKQYTNNALEVIFRCTSTKCHEIFIGYYAKDSHGNRFFLRDSKPKNFIKKDFSKTIENISPNFISIYNQALSAENSELNQICGTGYRKSLEFLIKDYLISKISDNEGEADKIINEQLGFCIENRIKDNSIKQVSKRAVWLGNDETHYFRKWEDKDLTDLKKLIDLTVHWIEAEALTEQLLKVMPDKSV